MREERLTGKRLYDRWAAAMGKQGVGVDRHHHLDPAEKAAWASLARSLTAPPASNPTQGEEG